MGLGELAGICEESGDQSLMVGRRLGHVPALDGVRGIAVALVIGIHAWSHPAGGGLGVDVFFVLSGFLITCLLLDEQETTGVISLRAFYRRRALRIVPAAAALLIVVAAAAGISAAPPHWFAGAAVAGGYLGNVASAYGWLPRPPHELMHFWSLGEEEQFYILWPLLLVLLLARLHLTVRRIAAIIAVVLALLLLREASISIFTVMLGQAPRLWFGPDTHLVPIVAGCLAATIYHGRVLSDRVIRMAGPVCAVICVAIIATAPIDRLWYWQGPWEIFPIACAIVVSAVAIDLRWLAAPLELRPVRAVGRISYGLYLWHVPLILWLGGWGVPLAFAAATASYLLVERRFLLVNAQRRMAQKTESGAPRLKMGTDAATIDVPVIEDWSAPPPVKSLSS